MAAFVDLTQSHSPGHDADEGKSPTDFRITLLSNYCLKGKGSQRQPSSGGGAEIFSKDLISNHFKFQTQGGSRHFSRKVPESPCRLGNWPGSRLFPNWNQRFLLIFGRKGAATKQGWLSKFVGVGNFQTF